MLLGNRWCYGKKTVHIAPKRQYMFYQSGPRFQLHSKQTNQSQTEPENMDTANWQIHIWRLWNITKINVAEI